MAKRAVHERSTKRAAAPKENDDPADKLSAVAEARAELINPTSTQVPEPVSRAPEVNAVVAAAGTAAVVPDAPVVADPTTDQFTRERPTQPQINVEQLLAAAPAASDAVAADAPSAMTVAVPTVQAANDERWSTASWLGALLMALGLVSLLGSSRTVRRAVLLKRGYP